MLWLLLLLLVPSLSVLAGDRNVSNHCWNDPGSKPKTKPIWPKVWGTEGDPTKVLSDDHFQYTVLLGTGTQPTATFRTRLIPVATAQDISVFYRLTPQSGAPDVNLTILTCSDIGCTPCCVTPSIGATIKSNETSTHTQCRPVSVPLCDAVCISASNNGTTDCTVSTMRPVVQ